MSVEVQRSFVSSPIIDSSPFKNLDRQIDADDYIVENAPPTMRYIPNFVTEEEEKYLVAEAYAAPDSNWQLREGRRVQNYGKLVDDDGLVTDCAEMPVWLDAVLDRLMLIRNAGPAYSRPEFMRVNTYLAGQGVSTHRDFQSNSATTSVITLDSSTLLDFYKPSEQGGDLEQRYLGSMFLEPRSLLLFSDEAFSVLTHGIKFQSADVITEKVFNRPENIAVGTVIPRKNRISLASRFDGKHDCTG